MLQQLPLSDLPISSGFHSNYEKSYIGYNINGMFLISEVVPENKDMKDAVGNFIYEYVEKWVGNQCAGKITGMILGLPLEKIKRVLYN